MEDELVNNVLARVDAWRGVNQIGVTPIQGGKTNRNYLVTVEGERFVLRISGENTTALNIDRSRERAATLAAASIGLAPEVVAFLLPEGHLVTRFIPNGLEWTNEDLKRPEIISLVADVLRCVHALPAIDGEFNPYEDIEKRLATAGERGLALPERLLDLRAKLVEICRIRDQALGGRRALCHNDPWHNNFLYDGKVRLLDWEMAGMGDPFFDIASLTCFYSPEQKRAFLMHYAGEARNEDLEAIEQMIFVAIFWNATWALMQIGVTYADYDYKAMADNMFGYISPWLN